jgi:hypothetical protein
MRSAEAAQSTAEFRMAARIVAGVAAHNPLEHGSASRYANGVKRSITLIAVAGAFLGLAACGRTGELKPAAGQQLPVKPLMARETPTPVQLLTPPAYAAPNRIDELMKRSTPREPDPFDLPPPSGQAPTVPVQGPQTPPTNQVGTSTPQ